MRRKNPPPGDAHDSTAIIKRQLRKRARASDRLPAMMGHREALKSGDELDAVGSWRDRLRWRPGERKAIKRQLFAASGSC
jgi:hypothetical protein